MIALPTSQAKEKRRIRDSIIIVNQSDMILILTASSINEKGTRALAERGKNHARIRA